ncbi:MAG: regulatory iron-sulfur-containing complex subunit RicT [bacterium]|nr:regulatory iron-sulfur-containing complex subunit RicT [bacterium]
MPPMLEIEFKGHRKGYAANPQQFPFEIGDLVIVAVERGHDLGRVTHLDFRSGMTGEESVPTVALRRATSEDLQIAAQNLQKEKDARPIARQKIIQHKLDMKLADVELQWDGRKMTFYFTADGRVDFRELVKDLASSFRTRIDLRQIGARDETKRSQGYGVCGCSLCCGTFLNEFKPISTQMPRDQFLPLNPSKLSGVCGRLKCCLLYELGAYRDFQRRCPKAGHPVQDEKKGAGVVDKLDLIREQIHIRFEGGDTVRVSPAEFCDVSDWRPDMTRADRIRTHLRVAAPAASPALVPEPSPSESAPEESGVGERVTLLAGGGLGLAVEAGGEQIQVGTDLNVAPRSDKPKKKRKRRHSRPKSGSGASGEGATPQKPPSTESNG